MTTMKLTWDTVATTAFAWRSWLTPVAIALFTFLVYYVSAGDTLNGIGWPTSAGVSADWYKHYVFQAEAFLNGTLDLRDTGVPDYYQDLVRTPEGEIYLPYQPAPAVLLMPFVAIWGTGFSESYFSMAIGAINVALFWYVLHLMGASRTTQILLVPFFAFGTPNFYSATTGTLWFYNHVVSVMFVFLAIIAMLRRMNPVVPALFVGLAFMSRQPTLFAVPFFLYWMASQHRPNVLSWETLTDRKFLTQVTIFGATLVPFGIISLWYNAARFGGVFDTGLNDLWHAYNGVPYTIYLRDNPAAERFDAFDMRNVPLHLYTMFLMTPEYIGGLGFLRPLPYGMSVLLTSPPLIYSLLVKRREPLKLASWLAVGLVSISTLLYYSQGWVQFGYRYMMDYLPFLMVLTALGFDDNKSPRSLWIKIGLVALSVVAGFWGRYWGSKLGW